MTPSSPRAQQHATRAAFFIPGFATAAWAPMVPYAKAKAGLSDASLGAVLLCLGLGSLLAMPLAGALTGRLGCRRVMVITCAMMLCALPLLVLAPSPVALRIRGDNLGERIPVPHSRDEIAALAALLTPPSKPVKVTQTETVSNPPTQPLGHNGYPNPKMTITPGGGGE